MSRVIQVRPYQPLRVISSNMVIMNVLVYLIPLGRWDGRKILGKGLKEESIKFMYRTLETIMAACRDLGVTKFSVIVDNDGLTLWKCAHWDCKTFAYHFLTCYVPMTRMTRAS